MQMLKNVYGDRIKIVPLTDLDASTPKEWTAYIFEKLNKLGMKEPTDYYTGSSADSRWYSHCFTIKQFNSAYDVEDRVLHILDRDMNPVPAATDIRTFINLRTEEWRTWVPAVNHELVISTYPEEFKIPIK